MPAPTGDYEAAQLALYIRARQGHYPTKDRFSRSVERLEYEHGEPDAPYLRDLLLLRPQPAIIVQSIIPQSPDEGPLESRPPSPQFNRCHVWRYLWVHGADRLATAAQGRRMIMDATPWQSAGP
eukprot:7301281-Pyramimonas_sp.AAC.1